MKKLIVNLVKISISVAIIAYLVVQARRHESFANLRDQPKDWLLLSLAWLLAFAAVSISFLRWYVLVRALDLPFRVRDAFRLGFLGYLLNFISVGSVGGDLFKAVFIAREQPGRRTQAVATVIADRVVGMYALFLLASIGILTTGAFRDEHSRQMQLIVNATLLATGIGTACVIGLLVPAFTGPTVMTVAGRFPKVGAILASLIGAARMYRDKTRVLLVALALSLSTHALFTLTIYFIARGLPGEHPTLANHFVIVPMGMAAGGLPLPLGALGAFEYVLDYLYRAFAGSNQGLPVALGYRLITVVIAAVGAGFYLSHRRELAAVMHQAELESDLAMAGDEPA